PSRVSSRREKTRCEVEEPMSTPTLVSWRFSSSCMWRWALENEPRGGVAIKLPSVWGCLASRVQGLALSQTLNSRRQTRDDFCLVGVGVKLGFHARLGADFFERLLELFAQEGIFLVVGDRRAAVFHVDGAIVDGPFAGTAAVAARRVGAEPGGETKRLLARAEVRVKPVAAHGRRAHHADRLVVLAADFFGRALFPGMGAELGRPGVGVAFAAETDQHRRRAVRVRFRIAAGLVLADPEIKLLTRHVRLDAPVAGRAAVVQRQLA